ncbi:DUF1707 domain-containing protein [Ammonicoccus fulvus]|uniref:DUF1707 domain-containing protein n=1 Tax=Ammonicoccus fulvus TaxID=3138240 RepID=A0ABZ3FSU0_9ACTN
MAEDFVRIGDVEREQAAQALAEHYAAGRLTREELDQRTAVVLRARNGVDLQEVLADLPAITPSRGLATRRSDQAPARKARTLWRSVALAPWAVFAVFFVMIWLFTGAGYFWPVWPIMGWGIAVAIGGVLAHTVPEVYLERQRERGRHRPLGV